MSKERIPNPPRRETLLVKNGNTGDIIKSLMKVADMDYQAAQVAEFAQQFKGTDPDDQYSKLKELWKYTRREIQYEEDPEGKQLIKDPARVYWDNRKGDGTDCKSLSLFEYAVCRAIGVPCYFEFVSFFESWEDRGQRITHVYPVAIVPGIGEVVLDAVHTKFDERPPGITRLVKKYTKVYSKMADISHIAGFGIGNKAKPSTADLATEACDRAREVTPLPFFDTAILSEGEIILMLKAARDRINAQYYQGTPQGLAARQAYEQKVDKLYKGLHTGSFLFRTKEQAMTRPAGGWLSWQQKVMTPKMGLPLLFDDAPEGAAVRGIGAIPEIDCNAKYPILSPQQYQQGAGGSSMGAYENYVSAQTAKRVACTEENVWRKLFNDNLDKIAHHPLYEFIPNLNAYASTPLVAAKGDDHKKSVGQLNVQSKISRTIIQEWMRTGIVYQNTRIHKAGSQPGPYTPEESISSLRQAYQEGIGALPIAAVIAIIGAIASALAAATPFIMALKAKRPTAAQNFESTTQNFTTKDFGPDKLDWTGGAGQIPDQTTLQCNPGLVLQNGICVPESEAKTNNNLPLIIGAAGLGLLLIGGNK